MPFRIPGFLLSVISALLLTACIREPKPRRYTEVAFHAKGAPMAPSQAPIQISWNLPKGWIDQPGGDPLRVASFLAPDSLSVLSGETDPKAVDISIVQFAGNAGGREANISRWMGQVKIVPSPEQIQELIDHAAPFTIASGQSGIRVDFTDLLGGDMTRSTSIIGSIIEGPGYTVFVKAMGDRDRLTGLKPKLAAFAASLSIQEEKK